ncbi:hypothetical protein DL766_006973 [Monosporascus sp. MC13-8B]|uniref:Uncharacterized protein n=1 Tax=Monosporascus cannonballus TaxID=155416 RepID=A0ABY0H8P0_9PEZI|nr:hypothetical protein DL763_006715 [Monosporascus cannonballus]RYO87369.1 hypothetical protein DL762_004299 [Monosporascus cannonballus]RYP25648.1 hypothetical protein DL766_006973 [Monosporascus sp. MC13-8B]
MLPSRLAASFRRAGHKTHLYRPTPHLTGPNSSQPFQNLMRSSFSTHQARLREQTKGHDDKSPGNPEIPRISFADLGMSRNVKVVVYVLIGIFGTIESIVWTQAIWRWFKGEKDDVA